MIISWVMAYEYLMHHFATESGKSKSQFYTPFEMSRVLAQILEIDKAKTSADTSVYDPTCGYGSLLLKVADQAATEVSLFWQEKDASTTGLAKMNMILHAYDTADIQNGNTLEDPLFKNKEGRLITWDYVVENPPFSDKSWSTGFDPDNDVHTRFDGFGVPPGKNGDYAYLLHIVHSLKSCAASSQPAGGPVFFLTGCCCGGMRRQRYGRISFRKSWSRG